MKTLITGANSYIGGYLKRELEQAGTEYICAARNDFDYSDINSIRNFFMTADIGKVIHLASVVDSQNLHGLFEINIYGLYNLLCVCKDFNLTHFTFVSGNNVYDSYQKEAHKETELCEPDTSNLYGISKYCGELIVRDVLEKHQITYANVRIADVYGPNQKHGNFIKAVVKNAKNREPLALYGEGRRVRDYIYVKDVAAGLTFISASALQGAYNLGTGVGTSVKEVLETVNDIYHGDQKIEQINLEKEDRSVVILDSQKLFAKGFRIRYNLKEGLEEILKGE